MASAWVKHTAAHQKIQMTQQLTFFTLSCIKQADFLHLFKYLCAGIHFMITVVL